MLAALIISLAALPVTFAIWSAITLRANLIRARATGLPIIVLYVTPTNPLWMAFGDKLVRLARRLGISTGNFERFYTSGWGGKDRYQVHAEYGDAVATVTPGAIFIYIADPKAVWDVIKRPRDFGRNVEQLAILDVYGKSLASTEGQEWQKHRKITAATFTESNNQLVWRESLAQGHGMLEYWLHRSPQPIRTVTDDCKTFTLNVLAAAFFTKPYPFEGQEEMQKRHNSTEGPSDDAHQYRDSLSKILRGIIPIAIFGGEKLRTAFWMPASLKQVGEAVENFRLYVVRMIEEERSNVEKNISTRKDLVAGLVRASLAQQKEGRDMTITEQDIISNTFVYAFAGNDTTAIALAHTIVNLAANPATQEWIREEILHYCPDDDFNTWPYPTWMKLKRCQAVVMESLRLCHPLSSGSKLPAEDCTLTVGNNTYIIPAGANVQVNFSGLHTNTGVWGPTALSWGPARFIASAESHQTDVQQFEAEQLRTFPEGQYIPWAHGERVCPGKRFSQVELAAVVAVLFRKYRVDPVPEKGESLKEARERAQRISLDVEITLLHEMYMPERLGLRWVPAE